MVLLQNWLPPAIFPSIAVAISTTEKAEETSMIKLGITINEPCNQTLLCKVITFGIPITPFGLPSISLHSHHFFFSLIDNRFEFWTL